MSTINSSDDELMGLEVAYMHMTNQLIDEGFSSMACAAVMTKLALMMYKSALNSEEYNSMVDTISENRDMIKGFSEYRQNGRLN